MSDLHVTVQNIEKIGHPVKEIRERALLSVCSKLECGYVFDDNLNRSSDLLKLLFKWFQYEECNYQDKVLDLLLTIIKSPSGKIFLKHYGRKHFLHDLSNVESKVDPLKMDHFVPIMEYLLEQRDVLNDESISIPELDLPGSVESFVDVDCSSEVETHFKSQTYHDKDTSVQEDGNFSAKTTNLLNLLDDKKKFDLSSQGIKIYLLPWCFLSDSDVSIVKMIEDTFSTDEVSEKTTNFLSNILLKDFPANLFLNRPLIFNSLLKLLNNPYKCKMALETLREVYKAIHRRLCELKDPDLKNQKRPEGCEVETQFSEFRIASAVQNCHKIHVDGEEVLKQIPLPILCLETIYIVVNCLGEFAVQPLTTHQSNVSLTTHDVNEAISLCHDACKILFEIITSEIWQQDHPNVFVERIYQKTVVVMRSLGDVLKRLRLSSTTSQTKDASYRVAYLRLLSFAIHLTKWSNFTTLVPSSFTSSLCEGLFDVSCMLLFSNLHNDLKNVVQNFHTPSVQEKEKISLYMKCEKISNAMVSSVDFIQNYSTLCEKPNVIELIRDSLPALAFHLNVTFIARVMDIFSIKSLMWKQTKHLTDDIRFITLSLLAHSEQKVKETFYTMVHSLVGRILSGDGKEISYKFNENSLNFLLHPSVLIEIASHGIGSSYTKVQKCAKDIIQYILRGKLLLSNQSWRVLLEALIPALPFIHVQAAHDDGFGNAVTKTLDLKISEQMLIPKIDVILGNVRLLYTKCFSAQMEGASNLVKLLRIQDGADTLLPKSDNLKADILCSAIRPLPPSNFNVLKHNETVFYEKGSLLQVLTLLSEYKPLSVFPGDLGVVDPTFRRSALAQLAVMLQQPTLHEPFLSNDGCKTITHYLRASLTTHEYTSFPESAISCVTIFNILCYSNGSIRQWLSEQQDIILNILRALLIFPNENGFPTIVSQLLSLMAFAQATNNTPGFSSSGRAEFSGLSIHNCIAKNVNLPYPYETYSETSAHQRYDQTDVLMSDDLMSRFLRTSWCCTWFGGVENIVRWPYLPDHDESSASFSTTLMINNDDLINLKSTCPIEGCVVSLYQMQNATSHKTVNLSLDMLVGYMLLINDGKRGIKNVDHLPWQETLSRFTKSVPASPKDTLLLLNVIKCISTYIDMLLKNDCEDLSLIDWLNDIFNSTYGVTAMLKQHDCEQNWVNNDVDQTVNNLRQVITQLICQYSALMKHLNKNVLSKECKWKCGDLVDFLTVCLRDLEVQNHYSLAFIGQILKCLSHLVGLPYDCSTPSMSCLIQCLSEILTISFLGDGYEGYKNTDLVRNSFLILCQLLCNSLGDESKMKVWIENVIHEDNDRSILTALLLWHNSSHLILRSLAFKLLAGLCTQPVITSHLNQKFDEANQNLMAIVIGKVLDNTEASFYREQVTILLSNLLSSKLARHLGMNFFNSNFFDQISSTVTQVCLNDAEKYDSENNVALEILSNRDALEVAYSKDEFTIPIVLSSNGPARCSVKLLTAFTDMIYNYILYSEKIPDSIVQSGILRFLFRCITLKSECNLDQLSMIAAVCRLLHRAINMSLHVHSTIVNTEDCVNALFDLYSPKYTESNSEKTNNSAALQEMWKWSLSLIGSIAETKNGFKLLWKLLMQSGVSHFFRMILISIREAETKEMTSSALFCLVNLLSSHILYASESNHIDIQNILNETPTSSLNVKSTVNNSFYDLQDLDPEIIIDDDILLCSKKSVKFDAKKTIVEDAVLGEDLCDALLMLYKTYLGTCTNFSLPTINDNPCYAVISCLCGLFATCNRAQLYAVDKGFIQEEIKFLCKLHYSMVADVKASDLSRKTTHPLLLQLDWTIQLLCNIMPNCPAAKEQGVDSGLVVPLNKSWPWCISTVELRQHTIQMICVYTNNCPKANQTMHTTVGTKSLLQEIIDLVDKEMNLVSRQRSLSVLRGCLKILENTSSHVHCRTIILKSDILDNLNKLHPAVTKRQPQWREVESMWESLVITLSQYSEGQLRVAEYIGTMCALIHQAQGLMLPVLGNCAFNPFNRPRILGSAEVLNIFSTILISNNNIQDILIVCGALWALGANHHKSKLALKTAGLTAKLSECLQKLKFNNQGNSESDRAVQIITYVSKIVTIP